MKKQSERSKVRTARSLARNHAKLLRRRRKLKEKAAAAAAG
jgi:hypothetical protein